MIYIYFKIFILIIYYIYTHKHVLSLFQRASNVYPEEEETLKSDFIYFLKPLLFCIGA